MSNSFDSTIRVAGVCVSFAFLLTVSACSKPAEPAKQGSSQPQTDSQLAEATPTDAEDAGANQSMRPATDAGNPEQQSKSLTHKQIIQRAGQAVVYLIAKNALGEEVASGTGFLIDERGWVATNYHVMRQAATTTGQTRDGTTIEISGFLAVDPDHDLVVLKLAEVPESLQPVPLTAPPEIEQGDPVTAVGHPAGFRFTATDGIVSAVRTTKELPPMFAQTLGSDPDTVWIQTSAAISGGNSGGPLFNNLGQVLGVNTWIAPGENLGFAVHVQHLIALQGDATAEPEPLPIAGLGIITDRAVAALWRDFNREYEVFMRAFQTAASEEAQQAIYNEQWPVPRYGTRFLDLAKANPGSTTSLQALVGACKLLQESRTSAERELLVGAVELLREHHLSDRGISEAAINLLPAPEDEVADLLTAVLEESPHRSVRGIACFSLASNLKARNQLRASRTLSMLGDAQPEYVALLELATNEYGDVRLRGSTLKEMLEATLNSSKVQPGMIAPEIEGKDLHGQAMRLSDHRGKVIMLDFWADWCPYCRQMYPHNRKLLEKYGDQPFALLGINADEAGRGRQVTDAGQVTWPSWDDGPTHDICTNWAVDGYPTIFLIDRRGIIRFKLSTTDFETLDTLVDNLLRDESIKLAEDIVPSEDEWKYLAEDRDPGETWYQPNFEDASWNTGKAPLGFGHDETTTIDHAGLGKDARMTFYFRKSFEVPDPTAIDDVVLAAHFDDGVVMYLNGTEVMRRHVCPDAGHGEAAYQERAGQGKYASHQLIDPQLLKSGTNVIAAAVHQASPWSADLRFDASLSSNSVARLNELIKSDETTARSAAIRIAGDLGPAAESLIPHLKPLLSDSNQNVRMQAYSSLMTIAPDKSDEFKLPVAFRFREQLERQQYASNLNARSWEMVCLPGRSPDDYRIAHKMALIAQALQPNSGPIKNTLAMALVRLGDYKEALTRLAEARKIHGIQPGDYLVAAVAYRESGKTDRAQEVFDKARELMQEAPDKEKQPESLSDLRTLEREVAQLLEKE